MEGKIAAANWARTTGKPLLGVCLGLQCAVIEFARNVLQKKDAHTTEINPNTTNPVVIDMPEHTSGDLGGTMRLGKRQTIFKAQDSIMRQLYGNQVSKCNFSLKLKMKRQNIWIHKKLFEYMLRLIF